MEFLEESDEMNQQYFENMKQFHIEGDREEILQFILTIKSISDHHHRDTDFIEKINKKWIIKISEEIYNDMINKIETNGNRYCYFFYPELERFKGEVDMKSIKEELLSLNTTIFEYFDEKRQEGENDSYICSLIRKDSVEDFITYINRHNISHFSEITPSIFETNSFLIDIKSTTLIEYSAFFGSIQIFQYLLMNNVELTPSLWLYSIHSKNAELIHLLESNQINPPKFMNDNSKKENSYLGCLIESIKCHHNDFSEYIENNLILNNERESIRTEILSNTLKYHNYSYFQTDAIKQNGFFWLCFYNYNQLFNLLFKAKRKEIEKRIVLFFIFITFNLILFYIISILFL